MRRNIDCFSCKCTYINRKRVGCEENARIVGVTQLSRSTVCRRSIIYIEMRLPHYKR